MPQNCPRIWPAACNDLASFHGLAYARGMIASRLFQLSLLTATCAAVVCSACGKTTAASVDAAAAAPAEKPKVAGALAIDAALETRLAAVYHPLRCALVLGKANVDSILQQRNFANAEAFANAFSTQAKVHPEWARGVLDASYKLPCNDAQAVAPGPLAAAATASAAP